MILKLLGSIRYEVESQKDFSKDVDNQELGLKRVMLILGGLLLPEYITHIFMFIYVNIIFISCISHYHIAKFLSIIQSTGHLRIV